jgi:hypothetical protein
MVIAQCYASLSGSKCSTNTNRLYESAEINRRKELALKLEREQRIFSKVLLQLLETIFTLLSTLVIPMYKLTIAEFIAITIG